VARMIGVVGVGCVAVWGGTPDMAGGVCRGAGHYMGNGVGADAADVMYHPWYIHRRGTS